jgi:hypothetical protein
MSSFKSLSAAIVVSALLAAPTSVWGQVSEPSAAAAQDPTFSIYSNDGSSFSRTMASEAPLGGPPALHMSVRPQRRNHATYVKRY